MMRTAFRNATRKVFGPAGALTAGVGLLSTGVGLVFIPAGLITAGVLLIAGVVVYERGKEE